MTSVPLCNLSVRIERPPSVQMVGYCHPMQMGSSLQMSCEIWDMVWCHYARFILEMRSSHLAQQIVGKLLDSLPSDPRHVLCTAQEVAVGRDRPDCVPRY